MLLAASPLGAVLGVLLVSRWTPAVQVSRILPMALLLPLPLLGLVFDPPWVVAAVLFVAGRGLPGLHGAADGDVHAAQPGRSCAAGSAPSPGPASRWCRPARFLAVGALADVTTPALAVVVSAVVTLLALVPVWRALAAPRARRGRAERVLLMPDRGIDLSFDELVDRARGLVRPGGRTLLGITGAPGAGKSTVAAALLDALGEQAVLVGMDGFHLANSELVRLGRRDRKGAPDTFDVDGYVALLRRLRARTDPVVYAPVFDRALEASIGSAVPVPASTPLVLTEGNYLLLDDAGWAQARGCMDEVWFLDVPPTLRHNRLLARRRSYGDVAGRRAGLGAGRGPGQRAGRRGHARARRPGRPGQRAAAVAMTARLAAA